MKPSRLKPTGLKPTEVEMIVPARAVFDGPADGAVFDGPADGAVHRPPRPRRKGAPPRAARPDAADAALQAMLEEQMEAAHAVALGMARHAAAEADGIRREMIDIGRAHRAAQAALAAHCAARVMDAFTRSMLALDRVRNGNRQTITVRREAG